MPVQRGLYAYSIHGRTRTGAIINYPAFLQSLGAARNLRCDAATINQKIPSCSSETFDSLARCGSCDSWQEVLMNR